MKLQELYDAIQAQGGCFFYGGPVLQDGIEGMAQTLIQVLKADGIDMKHAQSVFSVFIEMSQNVMKYSEEKRCIGPEEELMYGAVGVQKCGEDYRILCGNLVSEASRAELTQRLDALIGMNREEVRAYYKKKIYEKNMTSKGAGLGLIEVAKLIREPLRYSFTVLEDGRIFYLLTALVGGKSHV